MNFSELIFNKVLLCFYLEDFYFFLEFIENWNLKEKKSKDKRELWICSEFFSPGGLLLWDATLISSSEFRGFVNEAIEGQALIDSSSSLSGPSGWLTTRFISHLVTELIQ